MKLTDNYQSLLEEVIKQAFGARDTYKTIDDFFEFFTASEILKDKDLSDEELEYGLTGGPNDGGFDSCYLFYNGLRVTEDSLDSLEIVSGATVDLYLIQSKHTNGFKEDVLMKWKTSCENLLLFEDAPKFDETRYSEEIISFFKLFISLYKQLLTKKPTLNIKFCYCSLGVEVHSNVQTQAEELEQIITNQLLPTSNACVEFWGARELFETFQRQPKNEIELRLSENPLSLGVHKDFVVLVSLSEYYHFLCDDNDKLNKHLFESNVRDYQGKTIVNSEIYETLENNNTDDFWWLNNGITILCENVEQRLPKVLVMTAPSIVNGLQTSTEIYNFYHKNIQQLEDEKRTILIRIIVPESEESRDNIIIATNSQTNIPKSNLRANDVIHIQIEEYLKAKGIYYDRRKNYYKNQGYKPSEIISLQFLSQCLISIILHKPDYARARPSSLLTDDDMYSSIYNDRIQLEAYYHAALVGKKVLQLLKSTDLPRNVINDIQFYIIYLSVALVVGKAEITSEELKQMDVDRVNDDIIGKALAKVLNIYNELGGNGKVAKGSQLISILMQSISSETPEDE